MINTAFLLLAQYGGEAVIPLEKVCRDYFWHLSPENLMRKVSAGDLDLPLVRMDGSTKKSAKGVHLLDLAAYIDKRVAEARAECQRLADERKRALLAS